MNSKTSDSSHWTDPKDYGLPYVEITPLIPGPASQEKMPLKKEVAKVPVTSVSDFQPLPDPIGIEHASEFQPEKNYIEPIERIARGEKKSTNSWVWIVAVLALSISGMIIYQIQKVNNLDTLGIAPKEESLSLENNQNLPAVELNNKQSQEIQPIESESVILDSTSNTIPLSQTPQTGTTIESNQSGTLVRIESKKDRSQYFIVVGSLPSEALAVKEATQYYDRTQTLYLILPYDDVKNYRLAIGAFGSYTQATAELERAKGSYSEALWILKY